MKSFVIIFFSMVISFSNLYSQTEEVNKNLRLYAFGKIDEVKNNLLDLLVEYPDDPGVILLRGVVENDAYKAFEIYQRIVKDFADSEWADDAYWRIIQFYAVTGDLEKANEELEIFRRRYPTSVFLGTATDLVRAADGLKSGSNTGRQPKKEQIVKDSENAHKIENTPEKKPEVKDEDVVVSNPSGRIAIHKDDDNKKESAENHRTETQNTGQHNSDETKANNEDDESGHWGLQVGIYSSMKSAENERDRFLTKRLRTKIEEKEVNGKTMYAVVIGNYTSEASAEAAKMIVNQQCDCNPIIYKK